MKFDKTKSVWYQRYLPQTIDDVILPQEIKDKLKKYVETDSLPALGFWSSEPGLGKSSTCNAIINDLDCEAMFINSSMERSIDVIRTKIQAFASTDSFDDKKKLVVMDECLDENEEVIFLENGKEVAKKLNTLEKGKIYDTISVNLETGEFEKDTCEVVSDHEDDIYEVTLEDGRTILVTSNHPFIVEENGKLISKSIDDGLCENDDVKCR